MKKPTWSRIGHAAATAVVIAAAAFVWHDLPTPDDVYGPFDIDAVMGQQAVGRAITTAVSGVRIAPRLSRARVSTPALDAVGVWVAVDVEAMSTLAFEGPDVELLIGPNTYVPSDRLVTGPLGSLSPGIAVRDAWVFDVPPDLIAGVQRMTLRVSVGDGRLDSRLVVDISLDDPRVTRSDLVQLTPGVQVGL